MSELISGKDARLAWANGEDVEFYSEDLDTWFSLNDDVFLSDVFDKRKLRLKPRNITINGIEVPAPFKPRKAEKYWHIYTTDASGCSWALCGDVNDHLYTQFGAWRTELEVKQVVEALRSIFK